MQKRTGVSWLLVRRGPSLTNSAHHTRTFHPQVCLAGSVLHGLHRLLLRSEWGCVIPQQPTARTTEAEASSLDSVHYLLHLSRLVRQSGQLSSGSVHRSLGPAAQAECPNTRAAATAPGLSPACPLPRGLCLQVSLPHGPGRPPVLAQRLQSLASKQIPRCRCVWGEEVHLRRTLQRRENKCKCGCCLMDLRADPGLRPGAVSVVKKAWVAFTSS